jgi:hypothetical protein
VGQLDGWLEHRTLADLHTFLSKMHRYTTLEAKARVAGEVAPRSLDRWIKPVREFVRRFVVKQGCLDGPEGWQFCLLSGLSEWVLADKHRMLWETGLRTRTPRESSIPRLSYARFSSEPDGSHGFASGLTRSSGAVEVGSPNARYAGIDHP